MSEFSTKIAQMINAADELRQKNASFNEKVSNLVNIEETLNKSWTAPSQEVFHNGFIQDRNMYIEFYNGITEYIQALLTMAQEYADKESSNVQIANNR